MRHRNTPFVRAMLPVVAPLVCAACAFAQSSPATRPSELPKEAPGSSQRLDAQITGHVVAPARVEATPQRLARLELADGWSIEPWSRDLENPRILVATADDSVYVSRRRNGDCLLLRDNDLDGKADQRAVVATLPGLHGLALSPDQSKLYIVTVKQLYVADRRPDHTLSEPQLLLHDLPDGGQHPNRTLAFGPDGALYLSVGSTCNACEESNPESATLLRLTLSPDGKRIEKREIYATGLRNTIGFAWHPQSRALWGADHGIDWLGDDQQAEELNRIEKGAKYGWPYIYADGRPNPADAPPEPQTYASWAKEAVSPALTYTAHAAPMQLIFLSGREIPDNTWRHDAVVTFRGSWNRNPPSGYEVMRVEFDDDHQPVAFHPLVRGFLEQDADGRWTQFARLCGLTQMSDGSLLISDDDGGIIYRLTYTDPAQPRPAASSQPPADGARR